MRRGIANSRFQISEGKAQGSRMADGHGGRYRIRFERKAAKPQAKEKCQLDRGDAMAAEKAQPVAGRKICGRKI